MKHYEQDDASFPHAAYRVKRIAGVAFRVLGWETEPDEDTEWTGVEVRTGKVSVYMIGDDHEFHVDESALTPLDEGNYCLECGQIGCQAYD